MRYEEVTAAGRGKSGYYRHRAEAEAFAFTTAAISDGATRIASSR